MTAIPATVIHVHEVDVTADALDENAHVNNVEFVRWMNAAAVAHADSAGWSAATRAAGAAWVARSHHITYLRPAFAGDRVRVQTWVESVRGASSVRKYRFERAGGDGAVLAEAETEFVFVDARSGRPRRIPPEVIGQTGRGSVLP